jgi:hypothetical protein
MDIRILVLKLRTGGIGMHTKFTMNRASEQTNLQFIFVM